MKTPAVLIVPMLILAACSGGKADYVKTITDHLMSKAPAGYTVGVLDIEKLAPVSAAGVPQPITETFDFWLTPDGSAVVYQRKAR